MKPAVAKSTEVPLNIVGSNKFGRYPKISDESTYNMIMSDKWLVPNAGYKLRANINSNAVGRALFTSEQWGNMIVVIGNGVYGVPIPPSDATYLSFFFIGNILTYQGDVFIDENIAGQIAICDGQEIYIYNWKTPATPALTIATLPIDDLTGSKIIPGYITYHNGYFVTVNQQSASWFLSEINNGLNWNWFNSGPSKQAIQTKATRAVGALRGSGRGDLLYLFGTNVTQMWYNTGAALFPYQLSQSVNIDYGCLNASTIASMDNYVAWLGINERSGPVIMVSSGSDATELSTDGIDFKLADLVNPASSYAFFFKQDGHLLYQITFTDPADNFTLIYDFETKAFFYASDENLNYHPAERIAFFNNTYYFVSVTDGNIYEMSTSLTNYDYTLPEGPEEVSEIPRIRITNPIRLNDGSRFVINSITFTVEQGNDPYYIGNNPNDNPQPYVPRIDMALSKDGASVFGSYVSKNLNPQGVRKNRIVFWQCGAANDLTPKFRFVSKSSFLATDGIVNIYQ